MSALRTRLAQFRAALCFGLAAVSCYKPGPALGTGSVVAAVPAPSAGSGTRPAAPRGPKLAVNQVGYLPKPVKIATLKSPATVPAAWELLDAAGAVVATGQTQVFGADAASGEHVHLVDFTTYASEGRGYKVRVGAESSFAFDIAGDVYRKLKYDALAYFYHNRSGIEIAMPYAGAPELARPAGHLSDKSVGCLPGSGCDYVLDVSGGWYDAGDHGKYVVNGGISVWTLLNQYERAVHVGASIAEFGDGKLAIPESKNGTPDLLDEARWELEFLLKMQVPEGQSLAGMAPHKMHDANWTSLPLAPNHASQKRYLHKPSTAATLNLAATAAQGARIWKQLDPAFAARCAKAGERAWAAAAKNPSLYALPGDNTGGGPYEDSNATDEFYWAAAELFATTGEARYREFLEASPHDVKVPFESKGLLSAINWSRTAMLGVLSLVTVPNALAAERLKAMRERVIQTADHFLAGQAKEGYRTLLSPSSDGKYFWGSNSDVLNNQIVVAVAHDLTRQPRYLDAVVLGMDYLLGRNPLGQSYVTGYGDKPLQNPHHRFWAYQKNQRYPRPPAGAVSGGPNSLLQDPTAESSGLAGCPPQTCFVDHIDSWSLNEITINWNAPLAWVAAWLDEKAKQ